MEDTEKKVEGEETPVEEATPATNANDSGADAPAEEANNGDQKDEAPEGEAGDEDATA